MPKYQVKIWYTTSRFKELMIEAENETEADAEAWTVAIDADTSEWRECDDSNFEIDIQEAKQ